MKRTPKMQKKYDKYLENIKEKGITPFSENEVIKVFYNFEDKVVGRLLKNRFPYDNLGFTKETHLLLVINNEFINHEKAQKEYLQEYILDYEIIENKPEDQSVKEYRHYHLLKKGINDNQEPNE